VKDAYIVPLVVTLLLVKVTLFVPKYAVMVFVNVVGVAVVTVVLVMVGRKPDAETRIVTPVGPAVGVIEIVTGVMVNVAEAVLP
jgi:hypothetical protein